MAGIPRLFKPLVATGRQIWSEYNFGIFQNLGNLPMGTDRRCTLGSDLVGFENEKLLMRASKGNLRPGFQGYSSPPVSTSPS